MVARKSLSEVLENQGFTRADDLGLFLHKTPNENDRGIFFESEWAGMTSTVAVDEDLWIWVKKERSDLAVLGFKLFSGPTIQ